MEGGHKSSLTISLRLKLDKYFSFIYNTFPTISNLLQDRQPDFPDVSTNMGIM